MKRISTLVATSSCLAARGPSAHAFRAPSLADVACHSCSGGSRGKLGAKLEVGRISSLGGTLEISVAKILGGFRMA